VLRDFLYDNYRHIDGLSHLKDPRAEYRLPSGRKIDLLFKVRRSDALVVTELKLARGGQGTIAEVFDYVAELRQTPLGLDREIRVLVITGTPNQELFDDLQALSARHQVTATWVCYRIDLSLSEVVAVNTDRHVVAHEPPDDA
jgi:hypothetical protein